MKERSLLLIDVGNTCMVVGYHEGGCLRHRWQLSSERRPTADELALTLDGLMRREQGESTDASPAGIMVASVVPHLDAVLKEACRMVFGLYPAFVGTPEVKTGMAVDYKNPREVGADRIVNAVAAREHYGSPVIVMDCGTATTFDIVSKGGRYAGGLILPGPELALSALCMRAAKLPEVSFQRPRSLVGRDTIGSMQAGSYWSAVEGLSGIIRRLHAIEEYTDAPVIATGGGSDALVGEIPGITAHRPHLTLEGLYLLARRHFG